MSFSPGDTVPTTCPSCKSLGLKVSARISTDALEEMLTILDKNYTDEDVTQIGTLFIVKEDGLTDALNIQPIEWESFEEEHSVKVIKKDDKRHIFIEGDDKLMICSNCGWFNNIDGGTIVDAVFHEEKAEADIPTEVIPTMDTMQVADTYEDAVSHAEEMVK